MKTTKQKPRRVLLPVLVTILALLLFLIVGYFVAQAIPYKQPNDGSCSVQKGGGLYGEDVTVCP